MDKTALMGLVLGSAAVGALVSSVMALIGQKLERSARQKELLLKSSVGMTHKFMEFGINDFDLGPNPQVLPSIVYTRWFHRQLTLLLNEGTLDRELETRFSDFINKPDSELNARDKVK